jgi:hypothetical protein
VDTNDLLVKFNEVVTNPLFFLLLILFQLAEFWKIFRENRFLSVVTFVGVLLIGCVLTIDLFLTMTSESRAHPFWHIVGMVVIFILLSSYVLIYVVERWGYLLTERHSIRRYVGPNWVKWLDVIYLAFACGALVKALNSPTFGVSPDNRIDKIAPLFLAAAISIRLTKAVIEIFELDKRRALRWFER